MHLYRTGGRMTDTGCNLCETMFLRSNLEKLLKLDRPFGRLQELKLLCGIYTTSLLRIHEEKGDDVTDAEHFLIQDDWKLLC